MTIGRHERHLVPESSIETSSTGLRCSSTPLFEEEWNPRLSALISDVTDPRWIYWPVMRPALATDDYPGNAFERQVRNGAEERLDREKTHGDVHLAQELDPPHVILIFDRHSLPDVRRPVKLRCELGQTFRALRQDLKDVLWRLLHHFEYTVDELVRHRLMKQITHAVDEDPPGLSPPQRLGELVRVKRHTESVMVSRNAHGAKTQRKALGVAVLAARTDLGATSDGIPCRVSPLDRSPVTHHASLRTPMYPRHRNGTEQASHCAPIRPWHRGLAGRGNRSGPLGPVTLGDGDQGVFHRYLTM